MNIYIGTSGYSYPAWKGKFYPEKWPSKKMLGFYAEHFNSVEANGTFYRMPTEKALADWLPQVPAHFRFALKAPQVITHQKRLVETKDALEHFARVSASLGPQRGAILFQLPPFLKVDVPRLESFLAELPAELQATFEFRHESWFAEDVYALLQKANASLCVAEADKLVTPRVATAGWGYLRLRREDYQDTALSDWAAWVKQQRWSDVYIFFKHEDGALGTQFAKKMITLLG